MVYYILFIMRETVSFKMPGVDFVLVDNNVKRKKAFEEFKDDIRGKLRKHKINNVHDDVLKKILNDGEAITKVESKTAGLLGSGDTRTVGLNVNDIRNARTLLLKWDSGTAFKAFLKNRDEEGNAGFHDFYDYGENVVGTTMKSVIFPAEATYFYMTIDFELAKKVAAAAAAAAVGGRRTSRKIHNKQYSRRTTSVKRAKSASRKYRNRK